jgi:Zn-dependent peptidase ImmA (M78 family)
MAVSEHHLDPTLVQDLESRLGVISVLEWLDSEAERLANLGFEPGSGVRFTATLRRARNIDEISPGTVIGERACIIPQATGYVVHFRKNLPQDCVRFAIAHEIGHTYFFDRHELGKPISPLQSNASSAATVEHLCNFFAGALLLPKRRITEAVGNDGPSAVPPLHLIPALAREFQVADQAVARRLLFQLFPRRVAILRLRRQRAKADKWSLSWCAVPWDLRIAHSVSGVCLPLLNKGRYIPDDMVPTLTTAHAEHCTLDGRWWEGLSAQEVKRSRIPFKSRQRKTSREAFAYKRQVVHDASLFDRARLQEYIYLALPLHAQR